MKARSQYRPTDEGRRPGPVSEPIVGNHPAIDAAHGVTSGFDEFHDESFQKDAESPDTAIGNVQAKPFLTDTGGDVGQKPLFIPLKATYFDLFVTGEKEWEFRPEGPRWNARTCRIGRRVVLSRGYGKKHRLTGVVVDYRSDKAPTQTPAWKDCYGERPGLAACIRIRVDGGAA